MGNLSSPSVFDWMFNDKVASVRSPGSDCDVLIRF